MHTDQQHFTYKAIILGDTAIGKTSLAVRFADNTFTRDARCTMGVDFKSRIIQIDELRVRLNIFDTAGQQLYRSIAKSYFNGTDAVLFCYAINKYSKILFSRQSFENLNVWLKDFYDNTDSPGCLKVLVGTKSDMDAEREVTGDMAKELVTRQAFLFSFETSSLLNQKVSNVFEQVARNLLVKTFQSKKSSQQKQGYRRELSQMLIYEEETKKSGCC